jgi:hypothetical protein
VQQKGDAALATALKDFTEAVLDNTELRQSGKNEILSQLSFLAQQLVSREKAAPPNLSVPGFTLADTRFMASVTSSGACRAT